MRMPRKRLADVTPPVVQSIFAAVDSTDMNSRSPWTDTSF